MTNKIYKQPRRESNYLVSLRDKRTPKTNYLFAALQFLMIVLMPVGIYLIFSSQV